jgi:hypothetical protein
MLHWIAGYSTGIDPTGCGFVIADSDDPDDPAELFTYCKCVAESDNRTYVISGSGHRGTCDQWGLSLKVDGRCILDRDWWPTGRKTCGDRDIRTLSETKHVAQDWETAIVAYEIWRTGLWETRAGRSSSLTTRHELGKRAGARRALPRDRRRLKAQRNWAS